MEWLLFILLRATVTLLPVRSMSRVLTAMRGVVPSQVPLVTTWASAVRVWARRASAIVPTVSPSVASRICYCLSYVVIPIGWKTILYVLEWLLFILLRAYGFTCPVRLVPRVLTVTRGVVPSQVIMATFCSSPRQTCTRGITMVVPTVSPSVASRIY
jgi:hypothetical protein